MTLPPNKPLQPTRGLGAMTKRDSKSMSSRAG